MSATETTTQNATTAVRNRKVSVPISMPQSLLLDIDSIRGDTPRSVFVCKILGAGVNAARGVGAK